MFDLTKIPRPIADAISGRTWTCDAMGMSGATILLMDEMALKIEKISRSSEHERKLLGWLEGKLPAPRILQAMTQDGHSFLLMTKLSGEMACSDTSLSNMENTARALAAGLKALWATDTADCPCFNGLSEKIKQARYNIDHGLVDTEDCNPQTLAHQGFRDVEDLYAYLDSHRPQEDFVFSHGDYCLPNVFVAGSRPAGFLDWGNGGIADRWQDIALCVRSLRHNYMECAGYGEQGFERYKALLFAELGLAPDEEKIRYYILLDELF